MKSQFTETRIEKVMKKRGINRKSALKWLRRQAAVVVADGGLENKQKEEQLLGCPYCSACAGATNQEIEEHVKAKHPGKHIDTSITPATPEQIAEVFHNNVAPEVTAAVAAKEKVVVAAKPQTAAGSARSLGMKFWKEAGKPTYADYVHVCGDRGPFITWIERARVVGLSSAEELVASFQKLLAQPAVSHIVAPAAKATTVSK